MLFNDDDDDNDISESLYLRVCSFEMIWIRISDPRSLRSWWIKIMNRWILVQSGFIGSFDLLWSGWSRITDPDPDHPKGTHPKVLLTACQLCHVKHFKRVLHRFHKTYIKVIHTYIHTYRTILIYIYIPLSINCLCPNYLPTTLLHSCTVYNETYYLPSNDLSLIITDSSNFIIRVVPLCQWAVTFAGYNQKEK